MSLELQNRSLSNDYGQNWSASLTAGGTPGAVNSVDTDDARPFVLDVRHSPAIPHADEPVVVTARILAETVPTAVVHATANGTQINVSMNDNGVDGDLLAGDGVFSATLPAQPDQTVVDFYVEATTAGANTRTWPAAVRDGSQDANALYQVIDAFTPPDLSVPTVPTYYEIMTPADREAFTAINRRSDAESNATFISVDNEGIKIRYNTGVRIRGSGSRSANPPNNRINFPSDNSWNGVTALNLNVDTIEDQIAGSALFRAFGLPAAEAKAVRMYSNGTNLRGNGFYAHVEPLNSDFARNQFPEDSNGNLYKGRRPNESPPGGLGAGLVYNGPDPEPYVSYIKLTNSAEADWSDVINLTDVLNNADDATFLEDVANVVDLDQWLDFFAFNDLIANTEGGLVNGDRQGDDYAMYRGINDTRFKMVPHDLDSVLSRTNWTLGRWGNVPALNRLINHPDVRPRYFAAVDKILDDFLLTDRARIAVEQSLQPLGQGAVNSVLNFLTARVDYVKANLLRVSNDIETIHPVSQGLRTSDRNVTHVHGRAHSGASSVMVNGVPATFDKRSNSFQLGSRIQTVLPSVTIWNYLDDGSDQGTSWKEPGFVTNENWKEGSAQLGFGDGDERTVIDYGPDPANKHITAYFRHEFDVTDAWRYYDLSLSVIRDDGAIVYINGTEVFRDNLPGEVNYQTLALQELSGANERNPVTVNIDPTVLVDGKNVIAVEVHLATPDSPDASMTSWLTGRRIGNDGVPLQPGVNRVKVESYSGLNGTGELLATTELDFWYDDSDVVEVAGALDGENTWHAANGPFYVTSDLTINPGAKLTIEPGTSVYFAQDAELIVNGTLVAQGTKDKRIRFTADPAAPHVPDIPTNREGVLPDGPPRWDGIHFQDSPSAENMIAFADIEYAQDGGGSIGVVNSAAMIDNVTISKTHLRMIFGNNASMVVQNSTFPDMFGPDENPAVLGLDNVAEHIKVIGRTPAGGELVIRNNSFGTNKGHNDVIDADSNLIGNGPILQVIGNTFEGAGDELLDLGGDVFVYGNVFKNVFKDDTTSDRGYANVISTGDAGVGTTIVVAKNLFFDVDHAINLKKQAVTIFENNTVVRVHPDFVDRFDNPNVGSVVNLYVDEPLPAPPGTGGYLENNILWDIPRVFGNVDVPGVQRSILQVHNNIINAADVSVGDRSTSVFRLGSGNADADPRFADIDSLDFSLRDGSPAIPLDGSDQWGWLAPAVSISGEPASPSNGLLTQLSVRGPGVFAYRYRVNGGDWSDEIPIGNGFDPNGTVRKDTITLVSLDDGDYVVEVQGRDFAGNWLPDIATSRTWTVERGVASIQINEVLADNRGAYRVQGATPDVIELMNNGTAAIDLQGFSISDRIDQPEKFIFAAPQQVAPGGRLVLYAETEAEIPSGIQVGFSLDSTGEGVYLFAPAAAGEPRQLVDFIEFGNQLVNYSVGRVGPGREWKLTVPTIGQPNLPAATGAPKNVDINEWLALSETADDFVELSSSDPLPVNLGGYSLTDEIGGFPFKHVLTSLTFIPANGFLDFEADNSTRAGHVNFTLSADQEVLGLIAPDGNVIDSVVYISPTPERSQGRLPDGQSNIALLDPTPGWANGMPVPGELDGDGTIGLGDVSLLCGAIRSNVNVDAFDLNRDGVVDLGDMSYMIVDVLNTSFGDSNIDGVFNSTDLVLVFRSGEYEDGIPSNSTWAEGDWNCDGEFSTADLVVAFQSGGYTAAASPRTVPHSRPNRHDVAAAVDVVIAQLAEQEEDFARQRTRR
ncbi:MAG: CotH kinase family protein [Planctomycetales bacterium]|nr:CotH kinase family protein [Planctomycetales bacterium]